MDALTGYRSIPNASPALEAAADDAAFLRETAAKIAAILKDLANHQPVNWRADWAVSDATSELEETAAKLRGAADDIVDECEG